jgi:hypothetical protein
MLLSGNPIDGFGIPSEAKRGLGATNPLLTNVAQTQVYVPQPAAPPMTVAQAAHAAVTQNANPLTTGSGASACNGPGCEASWNGVCTSDGNLVYVNGAWHVASVADVTCTSNLTETAQQVIQGWKGYPIYVGPFVADFINNPNGQITNLTNPSQIGPMWGAWLAAQILQGMQTALQSPPKKGYATNAVPFTPLLPLTVGQTQWLAANGQPLPAQYLTPASSNPPGQAAGNDGATILAEIAAVLPTLAGQTPTPNGQPSVTPTPPTAATAPGNIFPEVGPFPYPAGVPAQTASGGHALYPNKSWTQADANGYLQTFVQYDNDPNTYSYYSNYQWLNALSPVFGQVGLALPNQMLSPDLLANYKSLFLNGPLPIAKFKNPITGANWGLWITAPTLGPESEGMWNTAIDAPNGAAITTSPCAACLNSSTAQDCSGPCSGAAAKQWGGMQIAIAPIPQESEWDQILDALASIPTELGEALWSIAGWLSQFVCGIPQSQMMAKVPPIPAAMAAAAAAYAIASAAQCGSTIDCTQPAYAVCTGPNPLSTCPPQCLAQPTTSPVTAPTPWYLQWWVLAAAGVGVVALLWPKKPHEEVAPLLAGTSDPKRSTKPSRPPVFHVPKGPPPGVPLHPGMLKGKRARR